MSYDVRLEDEDGNPVTVESHRAGGTYLEGVFTGTAFIPGTTEAELNITFNYGKLYREHLDSEGLKYVHGKKASEVIDKLEEAVKKLGTKRDPDYWNPTKGNAGYALSILLKWAKQYPDATFMVY